MDKIAEGSPGRLVAAWDIAGPLNLLNWELQFALLRLEEFDGKTSWAHSAVHALAVMAKDLVESVAEKDLLQDSIRKAWADSGLDPDRIHHIRERTEALHEVAEWELRDCKSDWEVFKKLHEQHCLHVVKPVVLFVRKLAKILERRMSEQQERIFRLSIMLDHVIYNNDVFKSTFVWMDPENDAKWGGVTLKQCDVRKDLR